MPAPKWQQLRVLVCGGRDFADQRLFDERMAQVDALCWIATVVQGDARGADRMAKLWAIKMRRGLLSYPADWDQFGKRAGVIRNTRMLVDSEPDLVLAFPGGRGTAHMVQIAREAGVTVWEA